MKFTITLVFLSCITVACSSNKTSNDTAIVSDSIEHAANGKNAEKYWIGTWKRIEWQNEASLEIKRIKGDSIEFSLTASSGGHTGELEGNAIVIGTSATYLSYEESDTCLIQFDIVADSVITVRQKRGSCFAAMGVTYNGRYINSKKDDNEQTTESLVSLGILQTKKQDSIFKALVGDRYMLFVNSTQLVSKDEDLDGFNASVHSSGIRGLFTVLENIIMIDNSDNIWAAVIDDNKVYYFSNDKEYKRKLPKTINNWRQRFKDYPIIYK